MLFNNHVVDFLERGIMPLRLDLAGKKNWENNKLFESCKDKIKKGYPVNMIIFNKQVKDIRTHFDSVKFHWDWLDKFAISHPLQTQGHEMHWLRPKVTTKPFHHKKTTDVWIWLNQKATGLHVHSILQNQKKYNQYFPSNKKVRLFIAPMTSNYINILHNFNLFTPQGHLALEDNREFITITNGTHHKNVFIS